MEYNKYNKSQERLFRRLGCVHVYNNIVYNTKKKKTTEKPKSSNMSVSAQ